MSTRLVEREKTEEDEVDVHLRPQRLGEYEILGELGRGAMGVVYKARDPKINRVVAVKTVSLNGHSPEEEVEYRQRFVREAEAAGSPGSDVAPE